MTVKQSFCSHCGTQLQPEEKTCHNCGKPVKKGISVGLILLIVVGIFFVFILPVIGIMAAILVPNFLRARAQGQYTACQSNCKNIATALEMYSTDHQGHYPQSLSELCPEYLKEIPTCQAAEEDTYSDSYKSGTDPDEYEFCCEGDNHTALADEDSPKYNSREGLIVQTNYTNRPSSQSNNSPQGQFTRCQSNLKNIGTALEMYSCDHQGRYPESLSALTPDYLKSIPTCEAAGEDTYSESYSSASNPDAYTFYCEGKNHTQFTGEDAPTYNSFEGLVSKP